MILTTADAGAVLVGWTIHCFLLDRIRRFCQVILDELAAAPVEKLHLPMPSDGGLRRIADEMTADPSDRATVHEWAKRIGVSERTLSRLVLQETGMSFGRWRQQLHIILALQWLSQGASVQSVATDLGYEAQAASSSCSAKHSVPPPLDT